jgi:DNA-binding SARP family transcriptional activator
MQGEVLGNLRLSLGERDIAPSAPKLRQLLGLLLATPGVPVHRDALVRELWDDPAGGRAGRTVQTHVYGLRKTLTASGALDGTEFVGTCPRGYTAHLTPGELDAHRFDTLAGLGRRELEQGNLEVGRDLLDEALALWRGPAFADVDQGPLLRAEATRLEEARLLAQELRIDADLRLGRHRELVGELRVLTARYPRHEGLHARLMVALDRAGRRGDALCLFGELRTRLGDELGMQPSAGIVRLHRELLGAGPVAPGPST